MGEVVVGDPAVEVVLHQVGHQQEGHHQVGQEGHHQVLILLEELQAEVQQQEMEEHQQRRVEREQGELVDFLILVNIFYYFIFLVCLFINKVC